MGSFFCLEVLCQSEPVVIANAVKQSVTLERDDHVVSTPHNDISFQGKLII